MKVNAGADGTNDYYSHGNSSLVIGMAVFIPVFLWFMFLACWKRKELKVWQDGFIQQEIYLQQPNNRQNRTREDRQQYDKEFRMISQLDVQLSCSDATDPQNVHKNRYKDTIPYNINRIVLNHAKNGDYINASRVGGIFIATQDPLPDQDEEFWSMLWENNVSIIIRLSSDSVQYPMAQYLPDIVNDTWVFGRGAEVKVTTVAVHHLGYIRVINLRVEKEATQRRLVLFYLTSWKAGGTPFIPDTIRLVASSQLAREKLGGMVVVHCGAGSGRTGTIIALWQIMETFQKGNEPNVVKIVSDLRFERPGMVQTSIQYAFLYKCLKTYSSNPHAWLGSDVLKL